MKLPLLGENVIENLEFYSRRLSNPSRERIEELFSPPSKIPSERPLGSFSFLPYFLLCIFVAFFFLVRLTELQVTDGQRNFLISEENRLRRERIRPKRGLIVDAEETVLARNLPILSLTLNSQLCQGKCQLSFLKANPRYSEILARYEAQRDLQRPFVILSNLTRDEVFGLGSLSGYPYLKLSADQGRDYPLGSFAAHVLGYLNEGSPEDLEARADILLGDRLGRSGIEETYDKELQGVSGYQLIEVDSLGQPIRSLGLKEPRDGKTVVLSLRHDLQETADEALREAEKKSAAFRGAVVVLDVRTGAVLSLVSHPSFDPNLFSQPLSASKLASLTKDKDEPFFNRAISGLYSPGSIFKVVVGSAALEEGVVSERTVLEAPGFLRLGDFTFADWRSGGHGLINLERAIAESADTFFYQIGGGYEAFKGLGPEKIAKFARLFGFGQKTLIDISGERGGLVPDPEWKRKVKAESWYLGNTYHFSIGQGDLLVTPLQVSLMTAAIGNGGVLFKPRFLSRIVGEKGQIIFENEPSVVRDKFLTSETLKAVREGMRQAAEEGGTAWPFFNFKVKVGAKTGTTEPGGEVNPHAWFTVFAPFEDPEIAVTVLVENGGQGADVAAPVAKKILEEYFKDR